MRSNVDVVIVGGGHNGLVAAAYLARAGRSCLVLERREHLGGAAVSERPFSGMDARLSRYSYLVSLLPKKIIDDLKLPIRLVRRRVSSYTPDPRTGADRGLLIDAADDAATRSSFLEVTGGEADFHAWQAFYARTTRAAGRLFPTLTEPLRSAAGLRAELDDDAMWRMLFDVPLGDTVADMFADDVVAGVVLTDALIGTFTDVHAPDLRQNRCFLYHVIGGGTGAWDVPVGGMGAVSGALAVAAQTAGAELRTGAEVMSIRRDADGADVEFRYGDDGFSVRASHVLVNAAPAELHRLLGEGSTPGTPGPEGAQLKVNLLLDRLPRLRDPSVSAEQAFAGTFHINETASQLATAFAEASAGRIPSVVPCEVYCHSLTDPTILGGELRERGGQTLTLFALHTPDRLFTAEPERAREAALEATLRSLDSVLAEPIAGCIAHDADENPCIEARSTVDLERELRLPGGHIFHRDLSWPYAETDDEVGTWGVETDHRRILLCGAGARRGGGVSGIPGHNAAMALLQRRR